MSQAIDPVDFPLVQNEQMVQELLRSKQDLENRQFIDRTLNEFSNLMLWRYDDDYTRWTDRILDALAQKLPILQAILYTADYDQDQIVALEWIGAFAYDAHQRVERWPVGEGLVGQAGLSQRRFWIEEGVELPEHLVASGLTIRPVALLVEPLIYNERTEGVLELSFAKRPDSVGLELVYSLGRKLGANLLTLRNQHEMRRLYDEMRQKSEALAAQEEEMRQNLEEMVATQEELKRAKEEIERRQKQFDRIASNVPGILYQYYLDLSTGQAGFQYASVRIQEIFGIPPDYLINSQASPLEVHPEDQVEFEQAVLESAKNLTPFSWIGRIKHPHRDEYIWIRADSTPQKESETRVLWDGYMFDITAQRQKDQALEEAYAELAAREEELKQNLEEMATTQEELKRAKEEIERRQFEFDQMANGLPGGLYRLRMNPSTGDSKFYYVSQGMYDLFGFQPSELINGEATFEVHPDDLIDFNKAIMESIQRVEPYRWRGRIRSKLTGEFVWVQADSRPKLEPDGTILLDGFMFDIRELIEHTQNLTQINERLLAQEEEIRQNLEELVTTQEELKRAKDEIERRQQALADQKAILDNVIDNMKYTFVAVDRNYNILLVNEVVRNNYRAMGIEVVPGMPLMDLLPPGQQEFYIQNYARAFEGESFNVINNFQMNGLDFRFSVDYYPVYNSQGEIVGAIATAIDLNQRQDIEMDASLRLDAIERCLSLAGSVSLAFDQNEVVHIIQKGGSWKTTNRHLSDLVAVPDRDRVAKSARAVAGGQSILLQNIELNDVPGSDTHFWMIPNRGNSGIPNAIGIVLTVGAQGQALEFLTSLS